MGAEKERAERGIESYTLEEHQHRFAVWAASSAAGRRLKDHSIDKVSCWFAEADLGELLNARKSEDFDSQHRMLRTSIVKKLKWEHGRAAKLLNVYLKAQFSPIVLKNCKIENYLHPPLDRLLLESMKRKYKDEYFEYKENFRNAAKKSTIDPLSWSKFCCKQYEAAINFVRACVKKESLWKIEYLWDGSQGKSEKSKLNF